MLYSRLALFACCCLLQACAARDRPIHPFRLEGFPGAPIEGDLFPRFERARWVFSDRLDPARPPLVLELGPEGALRGSLAAEGGTTLSIEGGAVEIRSGGQLVDRVLVLSGRVGDHWGAAGATATVFGYDRLLLPGGERRALVVAVDRPPLRDLYWFAPGMGWVRMRTERNGKAMRDAVLTEFHPGPLAQ